MLVNEKVGNVAKVAKYFSCEKCHYNTSKQYNYDKHLLTAKHKKMAFGDQNDDLGDIKSSKKYICKKCSKQYDSHNGIWLHKKKCVVDNCDGQNTHTNIESNQDIFKKDNMIEYLINENKDFKNLIMELIK
jgi:transposase-like protein